MIFGTAIRCNNPILFLYDKVNPVYGCYFKPHETIDCFYGIDAWPAWLKSYATNIQILSEDVDVSQVRLLYPELFI